MSNRVFAGEKDIGNFIDQLCDVYQYNNMRVVPKHLKPKISNWIFYPDSEWRMVWEACIMFLVIFYLYVVPYRFCFEVSNNKMSEVAKVVDALADLIFLIDVGLNFRTAYTNDQGHVITGSYQIARHYLLTWAPLDIVASIPFSWFILADVGDEADITATTDINKTL